MNMFAVILSIEPQRIRQKVGLPPKLTGGRDTQSTLPWPCVVIIEEPGVYLNRWAIDGAFAGDTWHKTVDDALYQASCEYGKALGEWKEIPPEVEDPHAYGLQEARKGNI